MEIIEHICGDFGVTVIYNYTESNASVNFFAAEITARGPNANDESVYDVPEYWKRGATSSMDHVMDPHDAERYMDGFVKWDGCSHVTFGDENGYIHICGGRNFTKLAEALATIYERCGEIMQEHGIHLLDGEFKCHA